VFEIASPSTWRQDLSTAPRGKLTLYGQLGVREYYVYDPSALAPPRLRVFTRRDESTTLEEARLLPSGGVWSGLLRTELRPAWSSGTEWEPAGTYLRVIDPATGAPIRVGDEVRQDYQAARAQVATLQDRLNQVEQASQERLNQVEQASQERLNQVEQAFQERLTRIERMFEERLAAAERARLDAEDRAR